MNVLGELQKFFQKYFVIPLLFYLDNMFLVFTVYENSWYYRSNIFLYVLYTHNTLLKSAFNAYISPKSIVINICQSF